MLHETTQRWLCRVAFLFGCVLPLAGSLGWAAYRQTPHALAGWEQQASATLGLRVEAERVCTPRPGAFRAERVNVFAPGATRPTVSVDEIELAQGPRGWRFAAGSVEIGDPREAAEALAPWLTDAGHPIANGRVSRLTLGEGEWSASFDRIEADLARGDEPGGATRLAAKRMAATRLTATSESNAAAYELTVTRSASGATLLIDLDTGDLLVSSQWLTSPIDGVEAARFRGTYHREGVAGHATGWLTIDESLTGRGTLRATWPETRVSLHDAAWTGGRFDRLHATLDARGGYVHRSLVESATRRLGCKQTPRVAERAQGDALWYDRFACEVELDGEGVTLVAACGEQDGRRLPGRIAHAVLQSGGEALLLEPREKRLPLVAVLQTLWPDAPRELPATAPAARLANRLPLR